MLDAQWGASFMEVVMARKAVWGCYKPKKRKQAKR